MVSFSPGWNFTPPTGLKYCCDYMLNFSLDAICKFPWENLLRYQNTIDVHACVPFSVQAEKNDSDYIDFSACLPGLKILALVSETRLGFSAWANIQPGLKPFPCNCHLRFKRISFRNRAEVSARLTYLAKVWTMIFCMAFSINQEKLWYPGSMMICKFRSEHSSAAFEA